MIINTLNARGLFAIIPGGDASQSASNLATLGIRTQYQKDSMRTWKAMFWPSSRMAPAALGSTTITTCPKDSSASPRRPNIYYVLGFSPENLKFDGSYHNLESLAEEAGGLDAAGAPRIFCSQPRSE